MAVYIGVAIIVLALGAWFYYEYNKRQQQNNLLEESLEDESLYVDGVRVNFEEVEGSNGDPDADVVYKKDTMFRDDLMKFEGEFLIEGLPLNEERRLSIDDAFLYLQELFGKEMPIKKPVLTPYDDVFPIEINELSEIIPLAEKIAVIMDIDPKSIELDFFEGSKPTDPSTTETTYSGAAGLYHGKNEAGKYVVTLADDMTGKPGRAIATIAHEFAHIKLLGEERMDENSEELTDMLPLFYGFGLFNSAYVFTFSRDKEGWSTSTLGYLSQVDWAYLFALYLYVRNEKEPEWFEHLNKTIAKDCRIAYNFIIKNPEKVLQPQA